MIFNWCFLLNILKYESLHNEYVSLKPFETYNYNTYPDSTKLSQNFHALLQQLATILDPDGLRDKTMDICALLIYNPSQYFSRNTGIIFMADKCIPLWQF